MPRFLCLWWPQFPAWALQRSDPALQGRPLLVYQAGHIVAVSPEAHQLGAQDEGTLHRAQSQFPQAVFRPLHGPTLQAIWAEILTALLDFTPYLESLRPGLLIADVRPPRAVLPLVRQWGVQGGVADDRSTAELAAFTTLPGTLRAVRPGQSGAFLKRIPLTALAAAGLRSDALERLGWFGWQRVGDLSHLTHRQLAAQFDQGKLLFRYAQAGDQRPVGFYRQPPLIQAAFTFDEPVREPYEWEPVLDLLIEQVLAALRDQGAQTVGLSVETPHGVRRGHRLLHEALTGKRVLQETARRLLVELLGMGQPMRRLVLQLGALHPLTPQQGRLFGRQRPPASVAIRALEDRFPGALRRIVMLDKNAYLPETAFRLEPVTAGNPEKQTAPRRIAPRPATSRRPLPKQKTPQSTAPSTPTTLPLAL